MSTNEDAVKMKLWLEKKDQTAFGAGGAALLEEIARSGSLAGAARSLNMSYRGAWGRLKKLEAVLGKALVEKKGGNKAGYALTTYGQDMLSGYQAWRNNVEQFAVANAAECFPWLVLK